jgi:2-phospho-L-lactate transferase/gluconeogenesis factor (CofD/UPF0052 family)
LLHLVVSKVTGLFHFLEIVEVVIFDSVNLVNLTEDLWSSGVHFKKTRMTFILVYINHHTGGNVRSTVARTIDKSKF